MSRDPPGESKPHDSFRRVNANLVLHRIVRRAILELEADPTPAFQQRLAPLARQSGLGTARRWAAMVAALAMAITLAPYLVGFSLSHGRRYMWLGYNLDDSCVYLSWMRQAAEGGGRSLNLFTTDAQHGMAPNPLFWTLGRVAGIGHLPLIVVYHAARIGFGFLLLMIVSELSARLIADPRARKCGFLLVCFSAGLGWLPFWWGASLPGPIDMWQPEAITFLSLYLSPLFCFSLCLQAGLIYLLLRGVQTRRARYTVCAGLCGFVLGLAHTYDVITMAAIWGAFLVIRSARAAYGGTDSANDLPRAWLQAAIAGLIAAPAVAYIAYQLKTEAVFQARANVATLTPAPAWIVTKALQ